MTRRKKLLGIKDVAKMLSLSERSVRNLVKAGHLRQPRKILGRVARWFQSDITAYLARLQNGDFDDPPPSEREAKR